MEIIGALLGYLLVAIFMSPIYAWAYSQRGGTGFMQHLAGASALAYSCMMGGGIVFHLVGLKTLADFMYGWGLVIAAFLALMMLWDSDLKFTGIGKGAKLGSGGGKKGIFDFGNLPNAQNPRILRIGGVAIPEEVEPLSFVFFGSPGSGKSQAINPMLQTIQRRGEIAVVADAGGEAMASLHRAGDVILNPLDARAADWSPFAEVDNEWEIDQLAKSIVVDKGGNAEASEWSGYAQAVVAAILTHCWREGGVKATTGYFLKLTTIASLEELRQVTADSPAGRIFDKGADKMAASVMGIVGAALAPWRYLDQTAGADGFSIKKWVAAGGSGWLWMPYRDDQRAVLAPLLGTWFDIVGQTMLAQDTNLGRRMWLVLDEFASLGNIPSIPPLLTKGRKKGVSLIAGIQTVAQVTKSYGREGGQEVLACMQNWLALRATDAETAAYLQKLVGKAQFTRQQTSKSRSDAGTTTSTTDQVVTEDVLLASEFQNLPSLTGFLKIAGDSPISKVQIPICDLGPAITPNFTPAARKPAQPVEVVDTSSAPAIEKPEFLA